MAIKRLAMSFAKYLAALYCIIFYRRHVTSQACDVLFLYSWPGEQRRTTNLAAALQKQGLSVRHHAIPSPKNILRKRLLCRTERIAPLRNCYFEYAAAHIVQVFRPRLILTFDDGSPYTVFLRASLHATGGRLINIAHGITGDSALFTNFCFDYYFVFGPSSLDAIGRQARRYGSTKIVAAGSYLIDEDFSLTPMPDSKTIVFFSSWLPSSVRSILLSNFRVFAEWARTQDEYDLVVKHHPLEDPSIIRSILAGIPRITFLPAGTPMKTALQDASLAIVSWSVASVEAALLGRPSVVINTSDNPDFLEIESYYLPRARTVAEVQARIDTMFGRYDEFVDRSRDYVRRHLAHTTDSIPFLASCIESLFRGTENFPVSTFPATDDCSVLRYQKW